MASRDRKKFGLTEAVSEIYADESSDNENSDTSESSSENEQESVTGIIIFFLLHCENESETELHSCCMTYL